MNSVNLACSGAKTATFTDGEGNFKPGLDFYSSGANRGQALMLQEYATTHNVKLVAISIGGNNFNFASIIQTCLTDWLTSPSWWKDFCNDDSSVTSNFTRENVAAQTTAIKNAILNVHTAMVNAGYSDGMYGIVVQDYESPIPNGSGFRYEETGYTRQEVGGCGFWNGDANWANATALPTIDGAVQERRDRNETDQRQVHGAGLRVQRAAAVREHGRTGGGERARQLESRRRGRQDRVGQA